MTGQGETAAANLSSVQRKWARCIGSVQIQMSDLFTTMLANKKTVVTELKINQTKPKPTHRCIPQAGIPPPCSKAFVSMPRSHDECDAMQYIPVHPHPTHLWITVDSPQDTLEEFAVMFC